MEASKRELWRAQLVAKRLGLSGSEFEVRAILPVLSDAACEARREALIEAADYFAQAIGSCGGEWWKASAVAEHLRSLADKEPG